MALCEMDPILSGGKTLPCNKFSRSEGIPAIPRYETKLFHLVNPGFSPFNNKVAIEARALGLH